MSCRRSSAVSLPREKRHEQHNEKRKNAAEPNHGAYSDIAQSMGICDTKSTKRRGTRTPTASHPEPPLRFQSAPASNLSEQPVML